jgi:aminoglycoside phosphotransferase (APT) family kinase protein
VLARANGLGKAVPRAAGITPQQVRRWLAESGQIADCLVTGPLAAGENSRLFYAERRDGAPPIAVKVCVRPHSDELDPESARRQYETLLRVHRAMGEQSELSVPRPYLVLPEVALLVTQWIAGKSITRLVFSWRCNPTRARDLVARGARWLKRFHACHALTAGPLDVEAKVAFIAKMEAAQPLHDPLFLDAVSRLRTSAGAAAGVTLERSWVHGDFTADNVMVSGTRTLGLDMDIRHENTVLHDLAPFLNHLELRAFHPSGWPRSLSSVALREAFLENYVGRGSAAIAVPLAWLRLYMILQGWMTARRKARSALRTRFVDLTYRTVASRLTRTLVLADAL